MVKRFNVTVPKKYIKDGIEKTYWANVGKLTIFPAMQDREEGYLLELNMFPNTRFAIFPDREREVKPPAEPVEPAASYDPYTEVTNAPDPDQIPF